MAATSQTIKQGSVMEGIFAMYCAAYLVDPDNGKNVKAIEGFIDDLRVDTTLGQLIDKNKKSVDYKNTFPAHAQPAKDHFKPIKIVTGKKAKTLISEPKLEKQLKNTEKYFESVDTKNYLDFSQVELKVRVKEAETGLYYGPNLRKLLDEEMKNSKVKDKKYGDIKKKMLFLINDKKTSFFKDLKEAKMKYIKNSKSDVVHWTVDADGIGGETSGGEIKQDVTIRIFANGRRIISKELNFSLKSDSVSIHGGGLYNSMPEIYDMFKGVIPAGKIAEGKKFLATADGKGSKETRKAAIDSLWRLLGESLPTTPDTKWSDHFWSILEKRLFGTGYQGKIQVLEMNKTELREITKDNFDRLRNSGIKLYPLWYKNTKTSEATPGDIRVMPLYNGKTKEPKDTNYMFKIRIAYEFTKPEGSKFRTGPPAPNKVYIELGGKKSVVHDENWDDYVKKGLVMG